MFCSRRHLRLEGTDVDLSDAKQELVADLQQPVPHFQAGVLICVVLRVFGIAAV